MAAAPQTPHDIRQAIRGKYAGANVRQLRQALSMPNITPDQTRAIQNLLLAQSQKAGFEKPMAGDTEAPQNWRSQFYGGVENFKPGAIKEFKGLKTQAASEQGLSAEDQARLDQLKAVTKGVLAARKTERPNLPTGLPYKPYSPGGGAVHPGPGGRGAQGPVNVPVGPESGRIPLAPANMPRRGRVGGGGRGGGRQSFGPFGGRGGRRQPRGRNPFGL